MTDRMPRVAVVMPTFQCGRFIREAIESVLRQSDVSVEVLVVDDGSTDDTRDVLAAYHDRVRYLHQENGGPARARNRGVQATRSEYVLFVDADDRLLPGALALHVAFLDAHPAVGVAPSGYRTMTESGELLSEVRAWHAHPDLDTKSWLLWNPGLLGTTLFRRAWLERVAGPFDDTLVRSEDTDLFLRLALAGCPMAWFEDITLAYRKRLASLTHDTRLTERFAETLLDKFFATPDLPADLRALEARARFLRLTWVAWSMRRSADPATIATVLRRSLAVSPYDPDTTVRTWSTSFALMDPDPLADEEWRALFTAMRSAAPPEVAPAACSGEALDWWLRVWRPYVRGDVATGDRGLSHFRDQSTEELVALARTGLMMTPVETMLEAIDAFWKAASAAGRIPAAERSAVAGLFLTAFGQAALAGRRAIAWRALQRALATSSGLPAIRAWLRFAANAAAYGGTGAKS